MAVLFLVGAASLQAADLDVRVYDSPEGERYFAASFAPVEAVSRPTGMDLVIIADTSASQVGPFRTTTLAAVEACLASLHPEDRVELIAADLDAKVMTESATTPDSPSMTAALEKLRGVTPLGASQLRESIETAADRLASRDGDRRRAILYLGDGFSMDATTLSGRWAQTASELRRDQIAVSAFALGPQRNAHLLAALANYTGGNLYMDDPDMAGDDGEAGRRGSRVGRILADWAHAAVVWPESASANEAVLAAYPVEMPPLRSDRDSIVIGRIKSDAETMVVDAISGDETLAWSATVPAPSEDNAYLVTLVSQASRDGGVSLTTLGEAGLTETARALNVRTDQLARVAQQAAAMGDQENAKKIKQAVLKRDPGNLRVKSIQHASDAEGLSLMRTAQLEVVEAVPSPSGTPPAMPADSFVPQGAVDYEDQGYYPPSGVVVDGRFLTAVDSNRRVFAQLLEKEVQNAVANARAMMATDPVLATQELKLMLQSVERAPELVASVRAGLIDKLRSAIRESVRQETIKDEIDRERQEKLAAARERELLLDRMAQDRERMSQLVERFNALIDERNFAEATEVTQILEELDRTGVVPTVARVWGEQKRYHELNLELRNRRAAMFLETMYQVEVAAIPFPDNVPMVYPDAETWRQITASRAKYKSVDVAGESASEKAISEALASPLPVGGIDFPEGTPLEEVIDYLRAEYEIEIVLDTPALEDLGLGPDEPLAVSLRNVSLRAAMRRMLSPLELTYVVDDEVLLITTTEAAASPEYLQVKVYPVADLVIPIPVAQPGGGAGLGGGGGGGGGGLGGGGGGGLGGGGGGGGGGLGGGGGAFSVPDQSSEQAGKPAKSLTLRADKPKQADASAWSALPQTAPKTTKPEPAAEFWLPKPEAADAEWDTVVRSDKAEPAALRAAAGRLLKQKRYNDATSLISAAIRAGKQQAWMYESLGIAMRLGGADKPAIERAILSAADLSGQPDQLVAIADYLTGMGLDRRAVQVYGMALSRAPMLQEILGPALAAAKRSDDIESLRWVTVAIAEQAWPAELQVIADEAERSAKALQARLDASNNGRLAERYRAELAEAQRRDCLVRVSWTGDADIDLAVKEPGGAVCWAGAERTAGGGTRIETASQDASATVHTETYVCPRGFAGDYEALISKVYGDVVADTVSIEITVAAGTEAESTQKQQVKLDEEGHALAKFNNPVGRRAEPIEEGQLAEALRRQESITRSVLSQQLSSMSEEGIVSLRPEERRRLRAARAGAGAVGFQPQITVLPEGVNLGAQAVVSADRRYVRVSPTPIFSVIGDISTFSFAGGGVDPSTQTAQFAGAQADPVGFGAGAGGAGGGGLGGGIGGGGGGIGGGGGGVGGGGGF